MGMTQFQCDLVRYVAEDNFIIEAINPSIDLSSIPVASIVESTTTPSSLCDSLIKHIADLLIEE